MKQEQILVIVPRDGTMEINLRLKKVLEYALKERDSRQIRTAEELGTYVASGSRPLRRILFAVSLGDSGLNFEYYRILRWLRENPGVLDGSVGGIVVDGTSELYTKSVARELVFTANCAGCTFVGRPLVEGTGSLANFTIVAQNMETDHFTAYQKSAALLVKEILTFERPVKEHPNLLVLHASSHKSSNTFAVWSAVKEQLTGFEITEIGLRNGTLSDCAGCPYKMCLHFGEQGSCFYGGPMVEEVYPAVRRCDALVMLCANYNDALSANLTACVNRLTALFRQQRFYSKRLFGLVVSGYSGGDLLARQLISALNMNKSFFLPPHFCLLETANERGSLVKLPGIETRARAFARQMAQS